MVGPKEWENARKSGTLGLLALWDTLTAVKLNKAEILVVASVFEVRKLNIKTAQFN